MKTSIRFVSPVLLAGLVACGAATEPGVDDVIVSPGGADATVSTSADGSTTADANTRDAARDAGADVEDAGVDADADAADGALGVYDTTGIACVPVDIPAGAENGGAACTSSGSGSCYPHGETAFSPVWVPPTPRSHMCSSKQIDDYYGDCAGPTATGAACTSWRNDTTNATCFSCLNTPSTASAYGVFILFPGNVVELNVAGCVALAEPCNLPCAKTWLASVECREAACALSYCPVQTDQIECAMTADACTACGEYAAASACLTELTGADHPAQNLCAIGSTAQPTQAQYATVAGFMCGP